MVKERCLWRSVADQVARSDLFCQCLSSDSLANQCTHDTQHGSTSLVELHIQLVLQFITLQEVGNKGASISDTVISRVVGSRPDSQFTNTAEEEDLGNTGKGNREKSVHAIGNVREADAQFLGEVSGEFDSGVVEQHTNNGSHGNTAVLAFDGSATFKVGMESGEVASGVLGRVQPSQRIIQTQRSSYTNGRIQGADTLTQGRRASR
mmetsp:Transcript_77040/g.151083  ORF Transcript_77040/g.151083 Transcript_77040/m.151083 type:complete len:207 (-) Transcript_77040:81-701(-)